MSAPKLAFQIFANFPQRDFSAVDVGVRLPVAISNPRAVVATLKSQGLIAPTGRQGHETLYRLVPGATPPEDARPATAENGLAAARAKRKKRTLAAQARAIRTMQRMEGDHPHSATNKARRVRKVRA